MNYKCFSCTICAESVDDCLKHLREVHKCIDGINEFTCLVNNDCNKSYLSVKSLKAHMKICVINW